MVSWPSCLTPPYDRAMRPVLHADCSRARIRRAAPVSCQVVRERDFRQIGTRVLDLSVRGMLLSTDLPVLTGEEVLLTFQSPTSHRWYDRTATVSRVVHGRRRGDKVGAVGIAFEPLDVWSDLLLCSELHQAPVLARRRLPCKVTRRT